MTAFTVLQKYLTPDVPGADVILLERAIKNAARTFCERTLVLDVTTSPLLDIVAGMATYTLPAVANRDIVRIKRGGVRWGADHFPEHRSEDQLDRDGSDSGAHFVRDSNDTLRVFGISDPWRTATADEPAVYYQERPNTIRLVPIPIAAHTAKLAVTYHLKPSLASTEVDDFVVANWYEALLDGARAELFQLKQKPWTNIELGAEYGLRFDDRIQEVINDRVSGFGSNDYAIGRVKTWT